MILVSARAIMFLRYALGITFLWFGILKLFNASPAILLIKTALPIIVDMPIFFLTLALLEIVLGVAFITNRLVKIAAVVMIGHLLIASITVLFTQGFNPWFPILSLEGEFVVKNLVLIAAGFVLFSDNSNQEKV